MIRSTPRSWLPKYATIASSIYVCDVLTVLTVMTVNYAHSKLLFTRFINRSMFVWVLTIIFLTAFSYDQVICRLLSLNRLQRTQLIL